MREGYGPVILLGGGIPTSPRKFPDRISYDETLRRLSVGEGFIDNVQPAIWEYEVSGKQVLLQWFSSRRLDRSRPIIGTRRPPSELDKVQIESWPVEYTTELMNVIHVLGRLVDLERSQRDLLDRICDGELLDAEDLRAGGAFDVADVVRARRVDEQQGDLLGK